MQQLEIPLGLSWFRQANKYIENMYQISTSEYGTIDVIRDSRDNGFIREFDYIVKGIMC